LVTRLKNQEQIDRVKNHKGHASLAYLLGPQESLQRVRFAADAVMTLLNDDRAIGFVNVSSEFYWPKEMIRKLLSKEALFRFKGVPEQFRNQWAQAARLFLLFVNLHLLRDTRERWFHTHGLEQFHLPDMQVKFADPAKDAYYIDLLKSASLYAINNGPVLKPNDTMDMAGDGIMYRIKPVSPDPEHPYGHFGAIELARA
jgi:hypothetical protein